MPTLLIRHATLVATMDDEGRRIADGGLFVRDHVIEQVGPTADLPTEADHVIDAHGQIVLPGLVNTHHHLFQSLTRAIPIAQNAGLFAWLRALYPIWARLTPEAITTSALVGLSELLLSGCTTASDHLYLFPNGSRIDDEIRAAQELGIRFHASRGSMSLGESKGGLPPDDLVEDEDVILKDSRRAIETFHDPSRYAMTRVVIAPCSPFSVTPDLMRESVALARAYQVHCHTHLAETLDEERYCQEQYGCRPLAYAEKLGWVGTDVWYAHVVHVSEREIELMARTGSGVVHCPSSNMRLASGIAPVKQMLRSGVHVGLGVDGSASNDAGHMLAEARQALLLQRVLGNPAALTAGDALALATRGGAEVLGRDDIGALAPGMAADIVAFDLDTLDLAGALHDPLAALVFCAPQKVRWAIVNGNLRVWDGRIEGLDVGQIVRQHNEIARALVRGE